VRHLLVSPGTKESCLAGLNVGGRLLRHYPRALRRFHWHLALTAAVSALATAALTIGTTKPALAEFEIEESQMDKGEVEFEYRGAVHWGLPTNGGGAGFGAAFDEEEADVPLRQSHDFELEWAATDWSIFSITLTAEQAKGGNLEVSAVEFESKLEMIKRKGDGIGFAFDVSYAQATVGDEANEIEFGPVVELATGKLLLSFDPFFTDQVGDNADTESLGFQYGWRAEYDFAKHWGVGVEMFGEIEDLANAGSFDDQNHSIGPTLFYNPGGDDNEGEEKEGRRGGDDEKVAGPPEMEFS
jgi:hypothetical protein